MKAATAAAKLEIYLPAAPEEFQRSTPTREELAALQQDPPAWLVELRKNGPHPRQVVAARLRVSTSGLARAGITQPLTTAEIEALQADPPDWLLRERRTFKDVRAQEQRLRERAAAEDH
ncbi:MAG: hypothetical protein H5T83_04485 [Actinotalea sp.]|nr:hypothetical protein [Actinotalea sp.]